MQGARPGALRAEGDPGAWQRGVKAAAVDRPHFFVDTGEKLAACVEEVERSAQIGLDTESNGFHAYFERVCLLQIATRDADWAVDALALPFSPLLPLFADPARECILHAAEYDVICMKRDYGLTFGRIFDTHAAAKTLGIDKVGLHNLLADQLGVFIAVDEQRSDWGKRPLSAQQLEYAIADVRYLLPLREKLGEQLAARALLAEAEAEFGRLIAKEPRPREFDPEGWQKMKAARTLDGRGRAVLRELYLLRDRRARELNRPAFKVLSDLFLSEAARRVPKNEEELQRVPGTSAGTLKRSAERCSRRSGADRLPSPWSRDRDPPTASAGAGRTGRAVAGGARSATSGSALAEARAEARKVEVQVIAPNAVLWSIARSNPSDIEALARVEGMDAFRIEQYGPEILETLRQGPAQQQLLSRVSRSNTALEIRSGFRFRHRRGQPRCGIRRRGCGRRSRRPPPP